MTEAVSDGFVKGWLQMPDARLSGAMVLAHGAGSDGNSRVLVSVAQAFADAGIAALRIDLPYRQLRPKGSPHPSTSARDRQGIVAAVEWLAKRTGQHVFVGGHSYGGRQASMIAAERQDLTPKLLLMSYPLHPPGKPDQLRTAHFPDLRTPVLFVHGTRDPFGTPDEMQKHLPTSAELMLLEKAGHELKPLLTSDGAQNLVLRFLQTSAT